MMGEVMKRDVRRNCRECIRYETSGKLNISDRKYDLDQRMWFEKVEQKIMQTMMKEPSGLNVVPAYLAH